MWLIDIKQKISWVGLTNAILLYLIIITKQLIIMFDNTEYNTNCTNKQSTFGIIYCQVSFFSVIIAYDAIERHE